MECSGYVYDVYVTPMREDLYPSAGVWLNSSQDLTGTMSQPNDPQSKSNADVDHRAAVALQQYNDTKGHFSLVRSVTALVLPFGAFHSS